MKPTTRSTTVRRFGISPRPSTRKAKADKHLLFRLPYVGALCVLVALAAYTPFTAAPSPETISTFSPDCATPKTLFHPGDVVCANAAG